jgi:hypothetical protein
VFSTKDFEEMCWHDNAIHGFYILEGEVYSELLFDIDYIVEWLPVDKTFHFRVAPAYLRFQEVFDLVISVNYKAASAAVQPMTIHEIHRKIITRPNGGSLTEWTLELNWPPDSFFKFQANGFIQTQRMEPITTTAQCLSPSERIGSP